MKSFVEDSLPLSLYVSGGQRQLKCGNSLNSRFWRAIRLGPNGRRSTSVARAGECVDGSECCTRGSVARSTEQRTRSCSARLNSYTLLREEIKTYCECRGHAARTRQGQTRQRHARQGKSQREARTARTTRTRSKGSLDHGREIRCDLSHARWCEARM